MRIRNIIMIIILFPIVIATSDSYTTETKNDFEVTWNLIKDSSNYKEYDLTIKNYDVSNRDFDLSVLLDFDVNADINIYELKDIPVLTKETSCVTNYDDIPISNVTSETERVYYEDCNTTQVMRNTATWKEATGNERKITSSLFKDYGLINIPPKDSKIKTDYYGTTITINGEKYFRVIITNMNPILYSGVLGIVDFSSGELYHPMINSTYYSADFTIDNSSSADIIVDSITLSSATTLTSKINAYWTFDTSANPQVDLVNSNTGNFDNTPTFTGGGIIGNTYDFDGSSDRILVDENITLDVTTNYTYSVWIYPGDDMSSWNGFTGFYQYGNIIDIARWGVVGGDDANGEIRVYGGNGGFTFFESVGLVSQNSWHHLMVTHGGSGAEGTVFYLNGTMDVNGSLGDAVITTDTPAIYIGGWIGGGGAGNFFDGMIDELALWNRTLTPVEVAEVYNSGVGNQYPFAKTDLFHSVTFNTGDNHNTFIPVYDCTGDCVINVTVENELFSNVSNGVQYNLTIPPVDGNATFNYTVELGSSSTLEYLNISFSSLVSLTPTFTNIIYSVLDSDENTIGNNTSYNVSNLQSIEYLQLNFTITNFQEPQRLYYTMNGTNSCALGNKQSTTCISYSNFVLFQNDTITTYFDGTQGTQGDFINCIYTGTTTRNYSCQIDEHYQNVFKWYSADYNFSDVKFQDANNQRISSSGARIIKMELDTTNIPVDAEFYKLDFRALPVGTPDSLTAYLCNSTYTAGNPLTNNNCDLIGTREASDFQDDGTKFREVFSKDFITGLGDIKYVILQSFTSGINNYYALKTIASKNATWTTNWEYSTNTGGTWFNLGDGYETEVNINWYNNNTAFITRINSNNTNSTNNVLEWVEAIKDFEPIVIITNPSQGLTTNVSTLNVSWIAIDIEGDVNVTVYLDGVLNQTGFVNSNSTLINDVSVGDHFVTVEGCDNIIQCVNDTNNFTIIPPASTPNVSISNFSCLNYGDCLDGKEKCLLTWDEVNGEVIETTALDRNCFGMKSDNFAFIYLIFGIAMIFLAIGFSKRIPLGMLLGGMIGVIGSLSIMHRWTNIAFYLLIIFICLVLFSVAYMFRDKL